MRGTEHTMITQTLQHVVRGPPPAFTKSVESRTAAHRLVRTSEEESHNESRMWNAPAEPPPSSRSAHPPSPPLRSKFPADAPFDELQNHLFSFHLRGEDRVGQDPREVGREFRRRDPRDRASGDVGHRAQVFQVAGLGVYGHHVDGDTVVLRLEICSGVWGAAVDISNDVGGLMIDRGLGRGFVGTSSHKQRASATPTRERGCSSPRT